jgi:hypothetical protein
MHEGACGVLGTVLGPQAEVARGRPAAWYCCGRSDINRGSQNSTPHQNVLRIALAHGDGIVDIEGHQVRANQKRAAIGFARSRHDIINGCRRNPVGGDKEEMRIGGQFRLGQREDLASLSGTSMQGDDVLEHDV